MRRAAFAFAVAVGLALALTWPLAPHLGDHLVQPIDDADMQCGLWWPEAFVGSVTRLEDPFFRPELGWPAGQDVRLLIWNFAIQVLFFPVYLLTDPVPSLNLVALGCIVLNGLCCAEGAWMLTRRPAPALAALAVAVCAPYGFWEGATGRPEQALWGPMALGLAALFVVLERPEERRAAWVGGVAIGLSAAIYWFYGYFMALALGAVLLLHLRSLDRPRLVAVARMGLLSLVVAGPFLIPVILGFLEADNDYARTSALRSGIEQQLRTTIPFPEGWIGHWTPQDSVPSFRLPALVLPLLGLGLAFGERRGRVLSALGLVALSMCLGPLLSRGEGKWGLLLPLGLLDYLPGFLRFWWPYRFSGLGLAALALVAGLLVDRVRQPWPLAAGILAFSLWDGRLAIQRGGEMTLVQVSPYLGLQEVARLEGEHPILLFPLGEHTNASVGLQVVHRQPVDAGLAWDEGVDRAEWERRMEELPLLRALRRVQEGVPHRSEDLRGGAGGFHFVLSKESQGADHDAELKAMFGPPIWAERTLRLYVVPGALGEEELSRLRAALPAVSLPERRGPRPQPPPP